MNIRVGAVEYLNSKPLYEGLTEVRPDVSLTLDLPSRLADAMARGELDVGLIPAAEYLRGDGYSLVPGVAVGSFGPVLSVTLFSRVPWRRVRRVALDVGSRTSAALTRVILRHRYGVVPELRQLPMDADPEALDCDAALLIGDRAMRACLPGYKYAFDLGQEWTDWTGLPFVFAVWAVRPGVSLDGLDGSLREVRDRGLGDAGAIAEREAARLGLDAGFCRRYLTNVIRFDLGPRERAGLARFARLAAAAGLVPEGRDYVEYQEPAVQSR